jgi:hypothetical protein
LFDSPGMLSASRATTLVDILCGAAICAVCLFVLNAGKLNILNSVMGIVFVSLVCFSTYNVFAIQNRFTTLAELKNENSEIHSIVPIFSLSKGYPNIVIIMADKAINGYVKPIFEEHPELNEQFDGFTLFPNTLSFSGKTITGVPPLWGGYEYTPKEMNARNSIPLVKKHNEALLLLPTILSGKGYQIAVTDPSWANYDFVNDTSIYNHLDNVKAFNTIGRYTDLWYLREDWKKRPLVSVKINRNAAWFSFLKTAPLFLRKLIYDDGRYWECDARNDSAETFVDSYAVLDFLPTFTKYDVMQPSAILLTNETAHNGLILQVPEYKPVEYVTNTGNGEFSQQSLYHANNAVYLRIGAWFDELKKNGVYDNTRIIIVSDHGSNLDAKITDTDIAFPNERRETYNPVLLFKDFNAHGKLKTDNTFMTNADVPVLALSGIAELVNPFTGKALTENHKKDGVYIIMNSIGQPDHLNRNTFKIKDDDWLFVKDNIFDAANWTKVKQ